MFDSTTMTGTVFSYYSNYKYNSKVKDQYQLNTRFAQAGFNDKDSISPENVGTKERFGEP